MRVFNPYHLLIHMLRARLDVAAPVESESKALQQLQLPRTLGSSADITRRHFKTGSNWSQCLRPTSAVSTFSRFTRASRALVDLCVGMPLTMLEAAPAPAPDLGPPTPLTALEAAAASAPDPPSAPASCLILDPPAPGPRTALPLPSFRSTSSTPSRCSGISRNCSHNLRSVETVLEFQSLRPGAFNTAFKTFQAVVYTRPHFRLTLSTFRGMCRVVSGFQ